MNPFDLNADAFLDFYMASFAVCVVIGLVLRRFDPEPPRSVNLQGMDPVAWAYLAGGRARATDTATVGLMQSGVAVLDERAKSVRPTRVGRSAPPFLTEFARRLPGETKLARLSTALAPALDAVCADLVERGLAYSVTDRRRMGWTAAAPMALLVLIGGLRIQQGLLSGHPVEYITVLTGWALFVVLMFVLGAPLARQAGRDALRTHRAQRPRLMRAPQDDELLLALALAGGAVLSGTPYAPFAKIRSASGDGGDFGGGDGGGGDGGDGGGGGCGGCGGH